jgi:protein-disulfide isomerase
LVVAGKGRSFVLKRTLLLSAALASVFGAATIASAQAAAPAQQSAPAQKPAAPAQAPAPKPLQLQSLDSSSHPDPFPPVNPKYFTASTPTVDTVNAFLTALWGYDPNRIWRVEAIQTTPAPGVSRVVVYVSDKGPNAKVVNTIFFVTPDGKHAIAGGEGVINFGATPFAEARKALQDRADGATRGSSSKDFMLVEFADLQCPHCKEARPTMERLAQDFPNARIVFQNMPIPELHPYALKAAAYGYCVTKQKNDAFFTYANEVFEKQAALTPDTGDQTLKDAVTKAGLDPASIDACAATDATKNAVQASMQLGHDVGVEQTPLLAVNGHMVPLTGVAYETLKSVIAFQAVQDGVSTGAAPPVGSSSRTPPSLMK